MTPRACFDEETVLRLIRRDLSRGELDDVDRHMAACDECRALVADAAKSFFSEERTDDTTHIAPVAASSEGLAAGQAVGRYVITRRIGAGGGGVVYAAHDPSLRRSVALKLLRDDEPARAEHRNAALLREARAMAQLSHPNVVSVYDTGTFERQVFIAMELVEGRTLRDWLHEATRSWSEVLDVFAQAGQGLVAAHAVGIVHRDFKPANVMVGIDGRVRVTDFGLAHPVEIDASDAAESPADARTATSDAWHRAMTLTATGHLKGTPAYMAPEQFLDPSADARADQFSFAVALYESLYGFRPFAAPSIEQQARAVLYGEPIPPPREAAAPAPLGAVLLRALSTRPERRFASMEQMLEALRVAARAPRDRRARRALAALVAVMLVAGAGALASSWRPAIARVDAPKPAEVSSATTAAPPAAADAPASPAEPPDPPSAPKLGAKTETKIEPRRAAPRAPRAQTGSRSVPSAPPRPYL